MPIDQKELKELSMSNLDKVLMFLNEGNIEEAKNCAKTKKKEAKRFHDLMANFIELCAISKRLEQRIYEI